jgi:hypothetical protein
MVSSTLSILNSLLMVIKNTKSIESNNSYVYGTVDIPYLGTSKGIKT